MPAFTCARAIGYPWTICFGVNILSLDLSVFKRPEPVDFMKNILLEKPLRTNSLASKKFNKFLRKISFSCFLSLFCGLVLYLKSLMSLTKLFWSLYASSKLIIFS